LKILLLEDDKLLGDAITKFLTIDGHIIYSYRDGKSALDALEKSTFDLLVLDINVPNIDGLTLLETLHQKKIHTPAIFISAIIDIDDISRAFDLGCYDYLKKPFHLKELNLRINKIFQTSYVPKEHFRLSQHYSLDIETGVLRFNGEAEVLSKRQTKILTLLARNRSCVVTYELFQDIAWDNIEIEIPTIRAEINRLKKILKEDFIVNVRNRGYMIKRPE